MDLPGKRRLAGACLLLGLLAFPPGLSAGEIFLTDAVKESQALMWWDPYREVALIRLGDRTAVIHVAEALALLDGSIILDLASLKKTSGSPVLSQSDWELLLEALREPAMPSVNTAESLFRVGVLVVDPGHGGRDPGATAVHEIDGAPRTLQEKDITLQVALELEKLLTAGLPDRKTVLTRKDDSYPTLERRVEMANTIPLQERETVLFISIHVNASMNTRAKGLEVWYIPQDYQRDVLKDVTLPPGVAPVLNAFRNYEYKVESRRLSEFILEGMEKELGISHRERGLKENPWFVVRMAKMPAVLVEIGFLTNKEDALNLADGTYLNKLARGIYTGIRQFIAQYEGTDTIP